MRCAQRPRPTENGRESAGRASVIRLRCAMLWERPKARNVRARRHIALAGRIQRRRGPVDSRFRGNDGGRKREWIARQASISNVDRRWLAAAQAANSARQDKLARTNPRSPGYERQAAFSRGNSQKPRAMARCNMQPKQARVAVNESPSSLTLKGLGEGDLTFAIFYLIDCVDRHGVRSFPPRMREGSAAAPRQDHSRRAAYLRVARRRRGGVLGRQLRRSSPPARRVFCRH